MHGGGNRERVGQVEQSYRDHLAAVKRQIREQTPAETAARLASRARARDCSTSASATSTSRATSPAPSTSRAATSRAGSSATCPTGRRRSSSTAPSGNRSVYAAKTLSELGYEDVVSMSGGFAAWKQNGHDWRVPRALNPEQFERYSRHVLIPEVGEEGQLKLLDVEGAPDRRGRARLAGRASTSPPPASARSGSSTPTWSTSRTSSARSCTPSTASASPRSTPPRSRSRRSTRASTSTSTPSGSPPRTCSTSSPATT